jgi:hypothetical protein
MNVALDETRAQEILFSLPELILDSIPGAWERTQKGLAEASRGEGVPLDELS